LLTALAVSLTLTAVVFAPLPLMLLRRNGGRISFLVGAVLASAILIVFSTPLTVALFGGAAIVTLVFCECEGQNIGYSSSMFVSLLVICGFLTMATGYAIQAYGFDPVVFFRNQIQMALTQIALPTGVAIDKEALVKQVPSALFIIIVFSVWMSSILVNRIEKLLGWVPTAQDHVFGSLELRKWKLPDSFVWIALASMAGTFFEVSPLWVHWLATNIFNVVVMLYFFQGLAVIVDFFAVKRVGSLWRVVAYMFIFSQLFLMVAFLGFVDLWMGFRDRTKANPSAVA